MSKHKDDEVPQQEAPQEAVEEVTEAAPDTPEESPEAALKAAEDRYLRLAAEYDNFRKRSARERDAIFADVRADTVLKSCPCMIICSGPSPPWRKTTPAAKAWK